MQTRSQARVEVEDGENSGRTLTYVNIVRRIKDVGPLDRRADDRRPSHRHARRRPRRPRRAFCRARVTGRSSARRWCNRATASIPATIPNRRGRSELDETERARRRCRPRRHRRARFRARSRVRHAHRLRHRLCRKGRRHGGRFITGHADAARCRCSRHAPQWRDDRVHHGMSPKARSLARPHASMRALVLMPELASLSSS